MAFDAFLKIEGIPGESTDDKHKDWIETLSFSYSADQPTSGSASSAGGASTERVNLSDFSIVKALDKASPKLFEFCCSGKHIKEVTLALCRSGGDKVQYMEYKLEEAIVSCYRPGGSSQGGDALPVEEVGFNYGKITTTYTQQKRADGSGGGQVAGGWDAVANKVAG
jgi:type VI secretion system secreted protein Hcp